MGVKQFLEEYVDGYLLHDLRVMCDREKELKPHVDGHLGYPVFMACAAGIETLGVLLTETGNDFAESGLKGFKHYWRTYLYEKSPENNVGDNVYQLVRNGIAHNFAAKFPHISTQMPRLHLRIKDGVPYIDATTLANDFEWSFKRFMDDFRKNKDVLEDTYERFIEYNEAKVALHRGALDKLHPAPLEIHAETATAQLKTEPTSSLGGGAVSKGSG